MSFKTNDKENSKDFGIIKGIELLEDDYSKKAFMKIKQLLSHNPLDYNLDPHRHRKLICEFNRSSKKELLSYLTYFLTSLRFQLLRKEQEEYIFRYFFSRSVSLHLTIFKSFNKYTLIPHIDVGIHQKIVRNQVTIVLLSELRALLSHVFPHIIVYIKYTLPPEERLKPENSESLLLLGDWEKKVETQFNRILHDVILSAIEESKKGNILLTKQKIKALFDQHVAVNFNLHIANGRVVNKIEQLIQQNIDHILEIFQKAYQGSVAPIKPISRKNSAPTHHLKRSFMNEDFDIAWEELDKELELTASQMGGDILTFATYSGELKVGINNQYKHKPKSVKKNKSDESQVSYEGSIHKYAISFCHAQLKRLLLQNDLSFEEAKQQLRCIFERFLKTVSSNSKNFYEESFLFFSREWFSIIYREFAGSFSRAVKPKYTQKPKTDNDDKIPLKVYWRWFKYKPLRIVLLIIPLLLQFFPIKLFSEIFVPQLESFFIVLPLLFFTLGFSYLILSMVIESSVRKYSERLGNNSTRI